MYSLTLITTLAFAFSTYAAPQAASAASAPAAIPTSQLGPGNPPQCMSVAQTIPDCGHACLEQAQSSIGCGPVDFACGCTGNNPAAIRANAFHCVVSACGIEGAVQVQSVAESVCSCAGMVAPNFGTGSE